MALLSVSVSGEASTDSITGAHCTGKKAKVKNRLGDSPQVSKWGVVELQ